MDSSEPDVFVDHKESVIIVPRPRQMSASKVEIIPAEETESAQIANAETRVTTQTASHVSTVTTQETLSTTRELSSASSVTTTTKVEKYATTIYTQRLSGRSSRSSDSGSDISSPTEEGSDPTNALVFGHRDPEDAHSPTVFGSGNPENPHSPLSLIHI